MPKYRYCAVTHCGCGVYSKPVSIQRAKKIVAALRAGGSIYVKKPQGDAEIERVLEVGPSAHRYWLWRRGKWRTKGTQEDPEMMFNPSTRDLEKWQLNFT